MTTVVNIKRTQSYDVYIGRGSKWGNPFVIDIHGDRDEVIDQYKDWLLGNEDLKKCLPELKNKVLGCFCKPQKCHGDVLAELVNNLQ